MSTPVNKKGLIAYYSPKKISSDSKKLKKCRKYLCITAAGIFSMAMGVITSTILSKKDLKEDTFSNLLFVAFSLILVVVLLLCGIIGISCKIIENEKKSYQKERDNLRNYCTRRFFSPRTINSMVENLHFVNGLEETNV